MQFIVNGPDIPDALLEAHEDGRVVFFCGAGISRLAGLPDFKGLVDRLLSDLDVAESDLVRTEFNAGRYDAALDLLERNIVGHREVVRKKLAEALKPKLRVKGASDTQAALLALARERKTGAVRLVTTNFDRLFEIAGKRTRLKFNSYAAPLLPIPKKSKWNGLVYLHGQLPAKANLEDLNRLVVTSGDFGLAYLIERWAARFVSELFRNYIVCFIGYSINDPVLRYMLDALAADRMLGESTPVAFAFGDCIPGEEKKKALDWEVKGVLPILYNTPVGPTDHSLLHNTLRAWASTYQDGQGKESIVVKHAFAHPQQSTQQDDFIGRMLWALSDNSGLPAKRFADIKPVPPLEWLLDVFSNDRYGHEELIRLGFPHHKEDSNLKFSFIRRPAPSYLAPFMQLTSNDGYDGNWDNVMKEIARWLLGHLHDPRLVLWVAERGGKVHALWRSMIEQKLAEQPSIQNQSAQSHPDYNGQPVSVQISSMMRSLWHLILNGRVQSRRWQTYNTSFFSYLEGNLNRNGLTTGLRLSIRELLAPKLILKKPPNSEADAQVICEPKRLSQVLGYDLVLSYGGVSNMYQSRLDQPWVSTLPALLDEFQQLLKDALDLQRELGETSYLRERTEWLIQSISPHEQNRKLDGWVELVVLLRDAWLNVYDVDKAHALQIAQSWFLLPYPTFKRLALFSASYDDCIPSEQWVRWLVADDAWWLWLPELRREVCRLLVLQGRKLATDDLVVLEQAIIAGPPRHMFSSDMDDDAWGGLQKRAIWLRLAKLASTGVRLNRTANERLLLLVADRGNFGLAADESDEFSMWMSRSDGPQSKHDTEHLPHEHQDIVNWLRTSNSDNDPEVNEGWQHICRTHNLGALEALCELSRAGDWYAESWEIALYIWMQDDFYMRAWEEAVSIFLTIPDPILCQMRHPVSQWLESVSRAASVDESAIFELCRRMLGLESQKDASDYSDTLNEPMSMALHHPVGHITRALTNLWLKQAPADDALLASTFKELFSLLCNIQVLNFRPGRVLLSSNLMSLYRVDREWTEQNLFTLLQWSNPDEAKAAWCGFLWSPRIHPPLLIAFKTELLDCAAHYDELGEMQDQYVTFLTYAALSFHEGFSDADFQKAFNELPEQGLVTCIETLCQGLEATSEQRVLYWNNRVKPFLQKVWPKSSNKATPDLAEALALLMTTDKDLFPAIYSEMHFWLKPVRYPHYVLHSLKQSGSAKIAPDEALHLIDNLVGGSEKRDEPDLQNCLTDIEDAAPHLASDPRMVRLKSLIRYFD